MDLGINSSRQYESTESEELMSHTHLLPQEDNLLQPFKMLTRFEVIKHDCNQTHKDANAQLCMLLDMQPSELIFRCTVVNSL